MNVDVIYYHHRAFRLAVYPTYGELRRMDTEEGVRLNLVELHGARQLTADGMRALIEAKQLPVQPAPEPETGIPRVGDLWETRCGAIVALVDVVPGEEPDTAVGFAVTPLTRATVLTQYDVDLDGLYTRRGTGEQHRFDLVQRKGRFL